MVSVVPTFGNLLSKLITEALATRSNMLVAELCRKKRQQQVTLTESEAHVRPAAAQAAGLYLISLNCVGGWFSLMPDFS